VTKEEEVLAEHHERLDSLQQDYQNVQSELHKRYKERRRIKDEMGALDPTDVDDQMRRADLQKRLDAVNRVIRELRYERERKGNKYRSFLPWVKSPSARKQRGGLRFE